jgi:tetratricopeptide (TPR) repeat protein
MSGFSHLQAQRFPEAGEALRGALDAGAKSPELYYYLATALFMQRRYADSLDHLRAQPSSPGQPFGMVLRARCLHHLRRPAEAIATLQTHLGVSPDDTEAHGLLALLLQEDGHDDEARAHVDAALERNPRQVEAMLALAAMQSNGPETAAARKSFDAILRIDPRCGRAWLGLALLNLRELRLDAARHDIEEAASHLPEHLGTWHVFAWTQLMLGDVGGAQSAFERAMSVDRNFGETHGGLAVVAALQSREEDARQLVRRALRLDPKSLAARYAEMLLMQRQGRDAEAKAVLDSILSRPAGRGGLQYRELVVAQLQALRARAEDSAPPVVIH